MPDLVNPEFTDGELKILVWADEKCGSCNRAQDSCPLIEVLKSQRILTSNGVRVHSCDLYDPDSSSPYYIPPDADASKVMEVNAKILEEEIRKLTGVVEAILGGQPI